MDDFASEPMPMICDVLAQLNAGGHLTVKELEFALGYAPRSGHACLNDRVLDAQQLRQLFLAAPARSRKIVQLAILEYFLAGTDWRTEFVPASADVNGDGQVNAHDIIDATLASLRSCADTVEVTFNAQKAGVSIDEHDAGLLLQHMAHAINQLYAARRAVSHIHPALARQ